VSHGAWVAPALSASFVSDRSWAFARVALNRRATAFVSHATGIIGMHYHTQNVCKWGVLITFFFGQSHPSTSILLPRPPEIVGITGVCRHTWLNNKFLMRLVCKGLGD
jgi:hypothetical protein